MTAPTLGVLISRPALEAPELLPHPSRDLIGRRGPKARAVGDRPADNRYATFCTAYDVPLDRFGNCVVVYGRRGEQVTTAACLVLATDRAVINKVVRRHLDVRKIAFAPMGEAVRQTGME